MMTMTKGMLMIIFGISGLIITVILAIFFFVTMRKRELKAQKEAADFSMISNSSKPSSLFSQHSDVVATESIYGNDKGTDILPESRTGTDVLESRNLATGTGTDILASEDNQGVFGTELIGQTGTEVIGK
ncbi:hypothetical protein DP73_03760 [Desulfosporosinus sp. HMP52]|uniref:hypothetical protein n=1 Tax=Desulfosporosinus sp. HMP52 TaxID=1487923 RepID=UPI00051FD388|nr:hypothetical protein [Desulfosporosinus sp. HMP52]KGK91393.1 hypothetical protein DP73_03760 [Desulfosporosinus sp. HMP52]